MSIREASQKIKVYLGESASREKFFIIAVIFLVGTAAFGLGRVSTLDGKREPVKIGQVQLQADLASSLLAGQADSSVEEVLNGRVNLQEGGFLVGSKNGNKYHFPWCSGAKRILEENKVYFESAEAARSAGYTPAANCKGLE